MTTELLTAHGLQCPACRAAYVRQRITDSRGRRSGGVRRRRECEVCGKRYSTVETIVTGDDLRAAGPWIDQHRKRVRELLGDVIAIQEALAAELASWPTPDPEDRIGGAR